MVRVFDIVGSLLAAVGGFAVMGAFVFAIRKVVERQGAVISSRLASLLQKYTGLGIARLLMLSAYGSGLLERNDYTYLIVPGQESQTALPVESSFVPLRFAQEASSIQQPSGSLLEADQNRILLIGEPGSGKSSLLKRELVRAARSLKKRQRNTLVPVLLKLSTVVRMLPDDEEEKAPELLGIVQRSLLEGSPPELEQLWPSIVSAGRLAILLDGLDEVPLDSLSRVSELISVLCESLNEQSPGSKVVVSTRPQVLSHLPTCFNDSVPTHFKIDRFSSSEIYEFLTRWEFPNRDSGSQSSAAEIFQTIYRNPQLRQLCQTPLLLGMYCALVGRHADKYQLPSDRAGFYDAAIRELVSRRRRSEDNLSDVRLRRWEKMAEEIAAQHLLGSDEPRNQVSQETIDIAMKSIDKSPNETDTSIVEDFIVNTGLLRKQRSDNYYFMHLTFGEYLAAKSLIEVEPSTLMQVISKSEKPTTTCLDATQRVVLAFVVPMLGKSARAEFLGSPVLSEDPLLLAKLWADSRELDSEGFRNALVGTRGILNEENSIEATARITLGLADLWLQLRPAVESGDLGGQYDISADLLGIVSRATGKDKESLIGRIASTDESAAWLLLSELDLSFVSFSQPTLQILSMPPIATDFYEKWIGSSGTEKDLRGLFLLEACLRNKSTAEVMLNLPAPQGLQAKHSWAARSAFPRTARSSTLVSLLSNAEGLCDSVGSEFDADLSRCFASIGLGRPKVSLVLNGRWIAPILLIIGFIAWTTFGIALDPGVASWQFLGAILGMLILQSFSTFLAATSFTMRGRILRAAGLTIAMPPTTIALILRVLTGPSKLWPSGSLLKRKFPELGQFLKVANR